MFEDFFRRYRQGKRQESDSYDERYPFKGSSPCFSVLNPHRGTRDFMSNIMLSHASVPNWCEYLCKSLQTGRSISDLSGKRQRVHDSFEQNAIETIVFDCNNNPIINLHPISRSNDNDNKTSSFRQLEQPSNPSDREDEATNVLIPVQSHVEVTCDTPGWSGSHESKVCKLTVWPHCTKLDASLNLAYTSPVTIDVIEQSFYEMEQELEDLFASYTSDMVGGCHHCHIDCTHFLSGTEGKGAHILESRCFWSTEKGIQEHALQIAYVLASSFTSYNLD